MGNEPGRPTRVIRVAEFLLTLGLGASLAIVAPRLWTTPAPAHVIEPPAPPVPKPLIEHIPAPIEDAVVVVVSRPASLSDSVTQVIMSNRGGIKSCVQRWLLRGHRAAALTIDTKLNIGISGRVKLVQQVGDPRLRALDPCIKEVTSRWVFPQSDEEYGVEFALTIHTGAAD
jgi:hypothetical protein